MHSSENSKVGSEKVVKNPSHLISTGRNKVIPINLFRQRDDQIVAALASNVIGTGFLLEIVKFTGFSASAFEA